eukprot:m.142982 g.142982  ORF g.142982 m.142982 type:complete len:92 (-) comp24201_c0_seq3:96-371(-)
MPPFRSFVFFVTCFQVGKTLKVLDDSGMADSTVVVIHGDHGFGLGEHASWHKQADFELTTRTTLMIKVPWKPQSHGKTTSVCLNVNMQWYL